VRCAAGCCIKSVKKCISRAWAPRGRDAWGALINIKSDRTPGYRRSPTCFFFLVTAEVSLLRNKVLYRESPM
jgi:hypothetical protein